MTGVTTVPPDVETYLVAVREALVDLPASERDDLLSEVEASLADAVADTGAPVAATLGAPEDFAAELRAAAGLHEIPREARSSPAFGHRVRAFVRLTARHPRVAALRGLAVELAPIWWVARAYVAVGAVAIAFDSDWSARYAIVPLLGTAERGLAAIALAVVVSVLIGTWARRHGSPLPPLALAANAALALAAVPVALAVTETQAYDELVAGAYAPSPTPTTEAGLVYNGQRVANIYPFSREGRLLHDVLLYNGSGVPLEIRSDPTLDPNRRFVVTNAGSRVFNVFPIRYYEQGTRRVARPNAAPAVEHPGIRTPPLRARRR